MSDLTIFAEALIATVARAFYDDETIVLIDVLIRDKFLRDDDMAPRLSLPARKLRATLQFLQEEHLVNSETVDDLAQGGSQATKFYYLDYNRAVHSIRLRLHLLRKSLEQAELRARSSSFYLCPGYASKRCNGRYTEEEAQQVIDHSTGLFLCRECNLTYQNDPNRPPTQTFTLQLVDNTKDLKLAMDNLRRVNVQLSAKYIGNDPLRAGIYDLLQKVRVKGKTITSNLPSENFALGIGSKRLAGTGRTAGIKAKKLEQQGVAQSAAQARNYLVGGAGPNGGDGAIRAYNEEDDLMFLKNAMGQEMKFTVEKGGGARAQLLATRRRRLRKLMETAASRVGASLPLHVHLELEKKRKAIADEEEARLAAEAVGDGTIIKKKGKIMSLEFLEDNIGRNQEEEDYLERMMHRKNKNGKKGAGGDNSNGNKNENCETAGASRQADLDGYHDDPDVIMVLMDEDTDALRQLSEENRRAAFQAAYKLEMDRQMQLLGVATGESPRRSAAAAAPMTPATATAAAAAAAAAGGAFFGGSGGGPNAATTTSSNNNNDAEEDEKSVLWEDAD